FTFTSSILAVILTVNGRQGDRARSVLFGLVGTIILILVMVPPFGLNGAVGALIGSEWFLVGCLTAYLHRVLEWKRCLCTLAVVAASVAIGMLVHYRIVDATKLELLSIEIGFPILIYFAIALGSGEGRRAIRFLAGLRGLA